MLNKTRILVVCVMTALFCVMAAQGQHFDGDLHDASAERSVSGGGGDFDIPWHTVDGGGGTSSGGDFVLRGTIGQPDAGDLAGGDFTLSGGFWQPAAAGGCGDCPTDSSGDGNTGAPDLAQLLACWGPVVPGCECFDANGDGDIGPFDLATLLAAWGPCP